MSSTEVSIFFKLALAVIKGDEAEATALKIQKKAIAVLTAQLSAKECHTISLEETIEEAEERLALHRVNNGCAITDNVKYIENLLTCRHALKLAELALKTHKEEIDFLKKELIIAKS